MEASLVVAVVTALSSITVAALTYSFTKRKEREADWRKYKYEQYKEFVAAIAAMVGSDIAPEVSQKFALVSNTLHLIGSKGVLDALHTLLHELIDLKGNISQARQAACLNKLIWEIRKDLEIPQTASEAEFSVRLSAFQANDNVR